MKIKKYLTEIKLLYYDLQVYELKLAEVRDRALGDGSPAIDKLNVMTSLPADPMAEAMVQYADMLDEYHELKRQYNRLRSSAEKLLHRHIYNKDTFDILYERFFNFKSYSEIGNMYDMNYQQCKKFINVTLHDIQVIVDNSVSLAGPIDL